ncbi:MAG: 3-hydroxyacyl-CoA dehydrogenase NAD-binding domain-containing protein [Halioglobus sp.]
MIAQIQRVCFVGAGNMGCFNATKAAISGYSVTLYDVNEESLLQALPRCEGFAAFLAGSGYCEAKDIPAALARIALVADLKQATADVDLVSESVFERLDIKREVHKLLDKTCPAKAIVTTNSSYLQLSEIEDVVLRGERFAAMHSYMGSGLVDIVGGARAIAQTVATLERYVLSINAVPLVLKKEHRGYVLNAILGPVMATAIYLVAHGIGSVEDVDRAWMTNRAATMGPLGTLDVIGLNLIFDSWLHREDEGPIPGLRPRVLTLLQPMVERNALGLSTGSGFYRYPDPAYQQAGFMDAGTNLALLYQPLLMALVASAVLVAVADVADPVDIDKAWKVGMSLDKGPFEILQGIGSIEFLQQFEQHVAAGRFNPDNAQIVLQYFDNIEQGDPR